MTYRVRKGRKIGFKRSCKAAKKKANKMYISKYGCGWNQTTMILIPLDQTLAIQGQDCRLCYTQYRVAIL